MRIQGILSLAVCCSLQVSAWAGGVFTEIYPFSSSGTNGRSPVGVIQGTDSNLYGMTSEGGAYGVGTVFAVSTNGGTLAWYASFTGTNGSFPGANPFDSLVQGTDGNFYGATAVGGADDFGTLFSISNN